MNYDEHFVEYGFVVGTFEDESKPHYPSYKMCETTIGWHVKNGRAGIWTPVWMYSGNSKVRSIAYAFTNPMTHIEAWLKHSIDLKKHWLEKGSEGNELFKRVDAAMYMNITQNLPTIESFWYIYQLRIKVFIPGMPQVKYGTLLRDLKLDRKLRIQELIIYLAFQISPASLESIFWNASWTAEVSSAWHAENCLLWNIN